MYGWVEPMMGHSFSSRSVESRDLLPWAVGDILQRYWDITRWSKNSDCDLPLPHFYLTRRRRWLQWNFVEIFGVNSLCATIRRCLHDPLFSCFGTTPISDGRTDGQTDRRTDTQPQHIPSSPRAARWKLHVMEGRESASARYRAAGGRVITVV